MQSPPFAGPVFTEWYWEPVFLLVMSAPFVLALTAGGGAVAAWRARRAGTLGTGSRIGLRVVVAYLILQLAVLLGWSVGWGELSDWRRPDVPVPVRRPVAPPTLPGYALTRVPPPAGALRAVYTGAGREIFLAGDPARRAVGEPACALAGRTGIVGYRGPCRRVPTGGGAIALVPPGDPRHFYAERRGVLYEVAWSGQAESDAFALAAALP